MWSRKGNEWACTRTIRKFYKISILETTRQVPKRVDEFSRQNVKHPQKVPGFSFFIQTLKILQWLLLAICRQQELLVFETRRNDKINFLFFEIQLIFKRLRKIFDWHFQEFLHFHQLFLSVYFIKKLLSMCTSTYISKKHIGSLTKITIDL